jgi:glycosyltransferase involved in cell wall biosynthesis
VHVRRNFADTETLEKGTAAAQSLHREDGMFNVTFASGSQGHEVDFKLVLPALEAFFAQTEDARLLLMGHFNVAHLPDAVATRTEIVTFATYDKYLATLARAVCAIMPLADDIFNRCKSAVRVIDAASVGVPSIVGTVGDLQNVVRHGKTGIIARTPQDWHDALVRFESARAATALMGRAARRDLETRWSAQNADYIIAPEIVDWVRG